MDALSPQGKIASGEIACLPSNVSDFDITSNDHADVLAGKAAAKCQLPNAITVPYILEVTRLKHIQKRLTTIAMYLPERTKSEVAPKPSPVPRVNRDVLLLNTTHSITICNDRYTCTVCKSSFKYTDPSCKHWLSVQCSIPLVQDAIHIPICFPNQVHLGNRISHVSHSLCSYRGLIYCKTCGSRTGNNQLRNLGAQCEPPGTAGAKLLRAINAGKMPHGVIVWPANL